MSDTLSGTFCDDEEFLDGEFSNFSRVSGHSDDTAISDYKFDFSLDYFGTTAVADLNLPTTNDHESDDMCEEENYGHLNVLRSNCDVTKSRSRDAVSGGLIRRALNVTRTGALRQSSDKHISKNAILARENREKKKQYIGGLERQVGDLTKQNGKLQSACAGLQKTVVDLRQEVRYLTSVIENQSALSRLLQNIPRVLTSGDCSPQNDCDFELEAFTDDGASQSEYPAAGLSEESCTDHCSVRQDLNDSGAPKLHSFEHDYARSRPSRGRVVKPVSTCVAAGAGVCLHVANNTVKLELCATCNENAQRSTIKKMRTK